MYKKNPSFGTSLEERYDINFVLCRQLMEFHVVNWMKAVTQIENVRTGREPFSRLLPGGFRSDCFCFCDLLLFPAPLFDDIFVD